MASSLGIHTAINQLCGSNEAREGMPNVTQEIRLRPFVVGKLYFNQILFETIPKWLSTLFGRKRGHRPGSKINLSKLPEKQNSGNRCAQNTHTKQSHVKFKTH